MRQQLIDVNEVGVMLGRRQNYRKRRQEGPDSIPDPCWRFKKMAGPGIGAMADCRRSTAICLGGPQGPADRSRSAR